MEIAPARLGAVTALAISTSTIGVLPDFCVRSTVTPVSGRHALANAQSLYHDHAADGGQ